MKEEQYKRAKERLKVLKGFYSNLITYVIINVVLIIINLVTNPDQLWFYWVTIFWGIGIIFHAFNVFARGRKFLGEAWEEKKIKEIIEKEEKNKEEK